MIEHLEADRPSWDCKACGKPWPCDPAREQLAASLDRTQLAEYGWARFEEAAGDMPDAPVGEMLDRFVRWT